MGTLVTNLKLCIILMRIRIKFSFERDLICKTAITKDSIRAVRSRYLAPDRFDIRNKNNYKLTKMQNKNTYNDGDKDDNDHDEIRPKSTIP